MSDAIIPQASLTHGSDSQTTIERPQEIPLRFSNRLMLSAFHQDGIKAFNGYRVTGLHVTMEEAAVWFAQLESGMDEEPPKGHV